MAEYVLSNKAEGDLTEIYTHSYRSFGEATADGYFLGLSECLERLANNPGLGRTADLIHPGLLRYEHARHVVFYTIEGDGIFVLRILHHAMDLGRHIDADGD